MTRKAVAPCALGLALTAGWSFVAAAAPWLCNGEPATHDEIPVKFWTSTFLAGNPDWIGGFQQGLEAWNRNPANFRFEPFVHIGTEDDPFGFNQPPVDIDNGRTEMWATTEDIFPTNSEGLSASAITLPILDGCTFDEVDVIFNANLDYMVAESWTDFAAYQPATFLGPTAPPLSVQEVATHELGHAAGFGEECELYSVMGDDNFHLHTNGDTARVYAGEDVHTALLEVYGPAEATDPSQLEDLSVVHFLRIGCPDGIYSQHDFTIPTKSGTDDPIGLEGLLSWDASTETTPFPAVVSRGQPIRVFFTYENLGASAHDDVPVGFYISANQQISPADTHFAQTTVDLSPNEPTLLGTDITLPVDLDEGFVWLGVIVDDGDTVSERFEDNNATFYPLKVVGFDDNPDFDGEGVPPKGLEEPRYVFQYVAKVVCGHQDGSNLQLTPGVYATTVNLFNGTGAPVALRKRLALSSPPDDEEPGETLPIAEHFLDPDRAMAVDCTDLEREAFARSEPPEIYEGFVVVDVTDRLAVTAVYSSAASAQTGGSQSSIDVETIFARSLITPQPDLLIEAADLNLRCGTALVCSLAAQFTVTNAGDAPAPGFAVSVTATPNDTVLTSEHVADGLAPGESTNLSLLAQVSQSPSLPAAICLAVDLPEDAVAETDETNNKRCFEPGEQNLDLTSGG